MALFAPPPRAGPCRLRVEAYLGLVMVKADIVHSSSYIDIF